MRCAAQLGWFAVVGAAALSGVAAAQEEGRPRRDAPAREGGRPRRDAPAPEGRMGARDPRMKMPGRSQEQAAMAVDGGKLFIVLGREIRRLDANTLEEEKKADIPVAGFDDEKSKQMQEKFIERFDKNGDGAISADELPRADLLDRFDTNGDGKVTADEAPGPKMMAARMPAGPTTLLVKDRSVYVFQGGALYRFDTGSLELEAKAEIAPKRPAGPGQQGGRKGGREGGDRPWDKRKLDKRDRGGAPEEPRVPEDPVRF